MKTTTELYLKVSASQVGKGQGKKRDVHGILLLDKPSGISSNQALQKAKRLFSASKAGHTGNLDPMASGLLPCCFGDATKVAHYMINADKTYLARCEFGVQMDTGDATGRVIETAHANTPNADKIKSVIANMLGPQQQIPPMYSALHHQGKRLYELARSGQTVERKPRDIVVKSFVLLEQKENHADFRIAVSKGTYIRTLLEDMAIKCGTLAYMSRLRRISSGIFSADKILDFADIEKTEQIDSLLIPADQALSEYQAINLDIIQTEAIIHGKKIPIKGANDIYRMYDYNDNFLGLGELQNNWFKTIRLFYKSYQQISISSEL